MNVHAVTLGLFDKPTSLVYGIGSDGRQDDGLGWAFIDRLEQSHPRPRACLRRTYQLGREDADLISRYTRVLFVDATKDAAVESFGLSVPEPKLDVSFTSHAISVPSILATTQQCFDHIPEAYLLAIRGYEWELRRKLSVWAQHNLSHSVEFFRDGGGAGRSGVQSVDCFADGGEQVVLADPRQQATSRQAGADRLIGSRHRERHLTVVEPISPTNAPGSRRSARSATTTMRNTPTPMPAPTR